MRRKGAIASLVATLLAPPCCAACGRPASAGDTLCDRCDAELGRGAGRWLRVDAVDAAWAARGYEGVARELVAAVKFRRLLPAIGVLADLIAAEAPDGLLDGALVPVPADPLRRVWRGFDPADLLAHRLATRTEVPLRGCLRRVHGGRQVGRSRGERLSSPPRVRAAGGAPERTVLVDDVVTTGATMEACARALRAAGAEEVHAVAFAASGRALGAARSRA